MNIGVGIIGATGFIATSYRSEIRECDDANIVALCARRRERLEAAGQEDGANLITHDWREVVSHPDVNFVLVATPDALHYETVLDCAAQGKHLLCEKPIGANAGQAGEMLDAYRDTRLGHFVPFWTRYIPVVMRAREIVASGRLGAIKGVIYRWLNPRPASMPFTWRDDAELSSAGSIADVGSHAYDAVRWILNDEASRVLAHADVITEPKPDLGEIDLAEALEWGGAHSAAELQSVRKGTAFDYANIIWQFAGGAIGSIMLSHAPLFRKGLAPEMEFHGTDASLGVDRINSQLTTVRQAQDVESRETVEDPGFGNRFARHVFPAIRQRAAGSPCEHPGLEDGYNVQRFTDAAALSAKRGSWVSLDEVPQ
ncbi:MAG: Gfo/Idh/MocA family oxidoreductase [Planctomycetota bacterium]|nr:Gfo/Idh/MocA family oxidoreductase [Planctomycetota bacterium]